MPQVSTALFSLLYHLLACNHERLVSQAGRANKNSFLAAKSDFK